MTALACEIYAFAFPLRSSNYRGMHLRILFLLLCATILSSCADDMSGSSQPKLKQEAHTSPMGQTTYTYRPVDGSGQ